MSGPPNQRSKATLGWPFSWALNRMLASESWARERLAPFAGRAVEVRADPLPPLGFTILPGGLVDAGAEEPSLSIRLTPRALVELPRGEEHFLRALEVSGDPQLAQAVMPLLRHLRPDLEEELSRLLGDVLAHRIGQAARSFAAWQADAARRLAVSAVDYAVEEKRMLVPRVAMERFAEAVAQLRDDIERLEKRVERLG